MSERGHDSSPASSNRRCPQCARVLPLTAEHWYRSRTNPAGFGGWCKSCVRAYRRARCKPVLEGHVHVNWDSKKRRWTAEEEQTLREEYPAKSTAEVAERLRRSEIAVRCRAHKLGLSKVQPRARRLDVWRKAEEIAQAYRTGKSQSALAREYDVGTLTIRQVLAREGCTIRGQGYYTERRRVRIVGELYVQCTKCKRLRPRTHDFFRKGDHSSDGLSAQCAQCEREVERRYLAAHPEKVEQKREYTRRYHRRMSRGLWAARWRLAAEKLLTKEDEDDGTNVGADRAESVRG
jgi:hypothetical protein